MAIIKLVKGDDNIHRWLNEYGDKVVVSLCSEFAYVKLDQSREFEIQLIDPSKLSTERFYAYPHYVVKTDSHNIFRIHKATPVVDPHITQERWTYESVTELELLEGHYPYFGVILDPVGNWTEQVTMKDYYKDELYKA